MTPVVARRRVWIVYQNKKRQESEKSASPIFLLITLHCRHSHFISTNHLHFFIHLVVSILKMDKRTAESPMDFEWQTRAPGDVTSPFYQLSMQHDNQKKRGSWMQLSWRQTFVFWRLTSSSTGPHSIFDSPEKKSMPALREPNSQPFLFSQPKPQQPPSTPKPFFNQSAFMTPRKFDVDFSSGAENMSSPEHADNEDTPEQPKAHRNSLFSMYGRFAPSPGRGEIPRVSHYSNALARRVQKRRRRDKALDLQLRRDSDEESDRPSSTELKPTKQRQKPGQGQQETPQTGSRLTSFSDFFALLEAHPNVPSILSWWAQLVVNLSLFSLAVYVVFGFVSAIRAEFEQAAEEVSDTILAEMAACAKSYVDNRCAGGDRLPALESVCENWERCMNRDPAKVGRAKVSAHTMAVIINSFIDPISWKAIVGSPSSKASYRLIFPDVFPCYDFDRHRCQQLVLPFLQKPSQSTRLLCTP